MHLVFVFGSLKKGFGNHRLLQDSEFIEPAVTKDAAFKMVSYGGFPGMYHGGDTAIHGEVYEVDDETFQRLDRLEGHPNFYQREQVQVHLKRDADDVPIEATAWMYINHGTGDEHQAIESGVWSHVT